MDKRGGWSGIGCVISDRHHRAQMMARRTKWTKAKFQDCRRRKIAASPSPWSQSRGGQLRALMTLSFQLHTVINPSRPSASQRSGCQAVLACCGAGLEQHTNKPDDMLSATRSAGQHPRTSTGRSTARQHSEASAAVHGCAPPCHRCWAVTAGLQHHARPRGVRVRRERCALQMPSNIFRRIMFATFAARGRWGRGWLRGWAFSIEHSSVERLFLTYLSRGARLA
jgi:hypothetical protein